MVVSVGEGDGSSWWLVMEVPVMVVCVGMSVYVCSAHISITSTNDQMSRIKRKIMRGERGETEIRCVKRQASSQRERKRKREKCS